MSNDPVGSKIKGTALSKMVRIAEKKAPHCDQSWSKEYLISVYAGMKASEEWVEWCEKFYNKLSYSLNYNLDMRPKEEVDECYKLLKGYREWLDSE